MFGSGREKLVQEFFQFARVLSESHVNRLRSERKQNIALYKIDKDDIESLVMEKLFKCAESFSPTGEYDDSFSVQFERYFRTAVNNGIQALKKQVISKDQEEYEYRKLLASESRTEERDISTDVCNSVLDEEIDERLQTLLQDKLRADLSDIKASISKVGSKTLNNLAKEYDLTTNQVLTEQQKVKRAFRDDKRLKILIRERLDVP